MIEEIGSVSNITKGINIDFTGNKISKLHAEWNDYFSYEKVIVDLSENPISTNPEGFMGASFAEEYLK